MRLVLFALISAGGLSACNNSKPADADPFPTFQACYDEHHTTEGFSTQRAIEICCIDHPIGGAKANTVCGATADACTTYVTANLMDSTDTMLPADISTACMDYVVDRGG
jgi:hypothetical protein